MKYLKAIWEFCRYVFVPQRDKGWASVRVTADPKLVAKYSKNAEVIRLRLSKK